MKTLQETCSSITDDMDRRTELTDTSCKAETRQVQNMSFTMLQSTIDLIGILDIQIRILDA